MKFCWNGLKIPSPSLQERGRKKREMIGERKKSKQPPSAPTTNTEALALPLSKLVGHPPAAGITGPCLTKHNCPTRTHDPNNTSKRGIISKNAKENDNVKYLNKIEKKDNEIKRKQGTQGSNHWPWYSFFFISKLNHWTTVIYPVLLLLQMMIYDGMVNETERPDFFCEKLFNLFQGAIQN